MQIVNRGLLFCPLNRDLMLLRGTLLFYNHSFLDALVEFDAVIDIEKKSKEPKAYSYLCRGRCHACLSLFFEAMQDFDTAI